MDDATTKYGVNEGMFEPYQYIITTYLTYRYIYSQLGIIEYIAVMIRDS